MRKIKVDLFENLNNVPNVPHELVQKGKNEEDNERDAKLLL